MDRSEIIEWVLTEFAPLPVITPQSVISQLIDNAVRYLNTHSAFKHVVMVDCNTTSKVIELPLDIKSVCQVYPSAGNNTIMENHPMWTLLGTQILDNVTQDLIHMTAAFKNYKIFIGNEFQWTFESSFNPAVPSKLYVANVPVEGNKLCVVGSKRVFLDQGVDNEYILDWLLNYVKALVKKSEGILLRKTSVAGVSVDGQEMYQEGKLEQDDLEARLAEDGQWLVFAKRF